MEPASTSTAMFATLAPHVRQALMAGAVCRTGAAGDCLVSQGDEVHGVFLVTSGVLRVFALHGDGREATLYRIQPHQICLLSLNSTFSHTRYPASVSVESERASVAVLPGRIFRQLFPVDTGVQSLVLGSLTATVADLLVRLDEALLDSMHERVVRFLVRHADADGCVRLSHQEIAASLGSSREVVSRELARLKRARRLTTGRRLIRLHASQPLRPARARTRR
jgi:CRP/FNR family transcriptional regulator